MPRPNKPRSIATEVALARRIAYERERLGMSYEGLASRMTKAGCAIQASGLYKIEKAGRRITVDELVGLAKVFDMKVPELLRPVELILHEEINRAKQAEDDAAIAIEDAVHAFVEARRARADLFRKAMSGTDARLSEAVDAYRQELEAQRTAWAEEAEKERADMSVDLAKRLADDNAEQEARVNAMSEDERKAARRRQALAERAIDAESDFFEAMIAFSDPDDVLGDQGDFLDTTLVLADHDDVDVLGDSRHG